MIEKDRVKQLFIIDYIAEGWIEMIYLLIGIIAFGIVVYIVTYVRTIKKSNSESNALFKKEN